MNSTEDSGERCSVADCEQTNILPFLCFNCKSMFCKNHFGTSQHGCKCVGDFFKDVNAQVNSFSVILNIFNLWTKIFNINCIYNHLYSNFSSKDIP